jgi:acyl transferase domain-containing protein
MTQIAVVGIDCRLPGAPDTEALWQLLMNGDVATSVVPGERWDVDRVHSDQLRPGTMNTRFAHFIDDADLFDHEFFGISPIEAPLSTPSNDSSCNRHGAPSKMPRSTRAHWRAPTQACSSA